MPRHDERPRHSLRISGTALSIRYSANLIFAAPEGVEAMSVQDSALLNSPVRTLSYLSGCSDFTTDRVDFRLAPPPEIGGQDWRMEPRNREVSTVPRRRGR